MNLRVIEVSAESLKGVGILASPLEGASPGEGEDFSWETVIADLGMPAGKLLAGRFVCRARPLRAVKFERHVKTTELISAVDGDVILCLAPPQEPVTHTAQAGFAGLRALTLRKGRAILLERGVWHAVPFPMGKQNVALMVVFRDRTGDDDLTFHTVEEPIDLVF